MPGLDTGLACMQTVYLVSVRASTWYVLRVTARNAAGSADCYLKFQTARDDRASTLLPRRVVVHVQRPFYARVEVVVSFCGVLVTIILVTLAVCIYCRWRHRQRRAKQAVKVKERSH